RGQAAMRDRVLLRARHLGHRPSVAGDHEHRVVAEAVLAARCLGDLAARLAVEGLDPSVGLRERDHRDEARGPIRHTVEEPEEHAIAVLRRRVVTEEPTTADPWRATEGIDLEARIVRDR